MRWVLGDLYRWGGRRAGFGPDFPADPGDKDGLPVNAAEGEVGLFLGGEPYLPLQFSLRGRFGDGALQYPCNKQLAARVGAQAIDIESGESFDRSRREQPRAVDPAGPDFPCIGLAPLPLVLHGRDIPI
jgi:hypothetical protein